MERRHSSKIFSSARNSNVEQLETSFIENQRRTSRKKFFETCSIRFDDEQRKKTIERQEIELCLRRLSKREDISALIVATLDEKVLYQADFSPSWTSVLLRFCRNAQSTIRNLDPTDVVQAVRLRTKTNEILMTVEEEQIMIALQILPNLIKTNRQE